MMRRLRQFWRRLSTGSQVVIVVLGVLGVAAIADDPDPSPQPLVDSAPTTTTVEVPTSTTFATVPERAPALTIPASSIVPSSTTATTAPTTAAPPTTTTSAGDPAGTGVTVVSVTDGDTLVVSIDGRQDRVRLIGINSPESGECFAAEATDALATLVQDRPLRLETDTTDRDQFDRLLRYVHVGDVFVNEALVEGGFAISRRYPPDTARAERLEAAQSRAEEAGVGLWAADACGAAVDARLTVGATHPDAEGNDNFNLNDEWVEIVNAGDSSADLSGWVVKDESASHRYSFPMGFVMEAGSIVRIHTGCGADTEDSLYWCNQGSAVWNNSGDTVFLLDPNGNTVAAEQY